MIRLEAVLPGNAKNPSLDMLEDFSLILNMQVSEPGEFLQRRAPFSQTFNLPFSKTNDDYFGNYYRVDLTDGDFNPAERHPIRIYRDDVLILDGTLRLQSVRLISKVYVCSILSDSANLFSVMGTKVLLDAFSNPADYNFEMDGPNVASSQTLTNDITNGSVGAGVIWVPLMDHGLAENGLAIYRDGSSGMGGNDLSLASTVKARQFKPCISLQHLLRKLITSNGYAYASTWLDSASVGAMYMTLADHLPQYPTDGVGGFKRGTAQITFISAGQGWFIPTWNDSTSSDFYDDGVFVNSGFLAPADGTYTFDYSLQLEFVITGGFFETRFNVGGAVYHQQQQYVGSVTSAFVFTKTNMSVTMNEGDTLFLEMRCTNGSQVKLTPQMFSSSGSYSYFLVDPFAGSSFDGTCLTLEGLPPFTQQDFFRDIMQRFNLVVYSDPDDAQVIRIEPWSDWIDTGLTQDWTEFLDEDMEQIVSSTSTLRKKTILLQDAESNDVGNKYFRDTNGYPFGRFRQDVPDEYATGELTNAPLLTGVQMFTIPTLQGDPNTEDAFVLMHRDFEDTGDGVRPVKTPPKLFFVTGLETSFNGTIRVSQTSLSGYQRYGPYRDRPATNSSESLYWDGGILPFGAVPLAGGGAAVPEKGLYLRYWQRYLAQFYDDDSRLYECSMLLPPEVLSTLRFNDVIFIKGNAYLLQKIAGYDVANPSHAKCTFLRETGVLQLGGCELTVSNIAVNGTVTFVDAQGNVTPATEACCEGLGYTFYEYENGVECVTGAFLPPPNTTHAVGNSDQNTAGSGGTISSAVTDNDPGNSMPRVTAHAVRTLRRTADRRLTCVETFSLSAHTNGAGNVPGVDRDGLAPTIRVAPEHTGVLVVQASARQTGGSAGTIGDLLIQEFRVTIVGDGTPAAVVTKITSAKSESRVGLDIDIVAGINANGEMKFSCTGQANKELEWDLECTLIRTHVNPEYEYALKTEAGDFLLTQASEILRQE